MFSREPMRRTKARWDSGRSSKNTAITSCTSWFAGFRRMC